jgi:hypothetical protein
MVTLLENLKLSAQVEEGPLGPYIPAYAAQLLSLGYTRRSSCVKIPSSGVFALKTHCSLFSRIYDSPTMPGAMTSSCSLTRPPSTHPA